MDSILNRRNFIHSYFHYPPHFEEWLYGLRTWALVYYFVSLNLLYHRIFWYKIDIIDIKLKIFHLSIQKDIV